MYKLTRQRTGSIQETQKQITRLLQSVAADQDWYPDIADLSSVRFFADDVAVMYLGRVVEIGPCEAIYQLPNHPYTTALLTAVPRPDPDLEPPHIRLSGRVPSAVTPPLAAASTRAARSRSARSASRRSR